MPMAVRTPFIRRLMDLDEGDLAGLFAGILEDETAHRFRPHPFTPEHAKVIAEYVGRDTYLGAWNNNGILSGYGMLRGWDAGYEIPALGVYVAPSARGNGLGRHLVNRLHGVAQYRGARKIRLKVFPDNHVARRIYDAAGYRFDGTIERGECVGYCELI